MNTTWHFLREFESKDLVQRHYQNRHRRELGAAKAYEITSAFRQGREYFSSYKNADSSVQPLLLYYGIVALSRALILFLNTISKEDNLVRGHGLSIKNWSDISQTKRYENIILKSSKGTFNELIKATKNKTYLRIGSSEVNDKIDNVLPELEFEFTLKEIAYSLPDLADSIKAWLNEEYPTKGVIRLDGIKGENGKAYVVLHEAINDEELIRLFPKDVFRDLESIKIGTDIQYSFSPTKPHRVVQKWSESFDIVGAPYIAPPLSSAVLLNDISVLFSAAYIFGMISRYYPSTWNNINKGIQADSIYPFAINLMSFLEDTFPKIVLDFLKSPYEFEQYADNQG